MLRRPRSIAAVVVAVALSLVSLSALSGCATEITGTATAGKIPSSSSASEDAAEESSEESTETSAGESSDESSVTEESTATDGPIPPVEPTSDSGGSEGSGGSGGSQGDAAAWFSTLCVGFDDLTSYSSPDVSGMTDEAALQTIVDAYTAMSQIAFDTADQLGALPEPAIANGDTVATAVTQWFSTVGNVYSGGAAAIANGSFTDGDALADQIDQIEAGLDGVNQTLGSAMGLLDDDTKQLMAGLPECAALVRG